MASNLRANRYWRLAELVPHTAGPKIFLESCVGQAAVEIDRPPIRSIPGMNAVRRLEMEHVGHSTTKTVHDRLAAEVVIVVAGKVKIRFIRESVKFLDGNPYRNLSPRADINLFADSLSAHALR